MHHIRKSSDPVQVISPLPVKQNLRSSTSAAVSSPKINRRRKIDQASSYSDDQEHHHQQLQQNERDPLVSFVFQDDDEGNSEIRRVYLEAEEEFREILGGGLYAHNVMYSLKKRRKKGGSYLNMNSNNNNNNNVSVIKRDTNAIDDNNNNDDCSIDLGVSGDIDFSLDVEDYLAFGFPRLGGTPSPYDDRQVGEEDDSFNSESDHNEGFDEDDELEYLRERELSSSRNLHHSGHPLTSNSPSYVDIADNEYYLSCCNFSSPPVRVSNPISKNPLFGERSVPVMKSLVPSSSSSSPFDKDVNESSSPRGRTGRRRSRISSEPPRKFWELGIDFPSNGNDVECF